MRQHVFYAMYLNQIFHHFLFGNDNLFILNNKRILSTIIHQIHILQVYPAIRNGELLMNRIIPQKSECPAYTGSEWKRTGDNSDETQHHQYRKGHKPPLILQSSTTFTSMGNGDS